MKKKKVWFVSAVILLLAFWYAYLPPSMYQRLYWDCRGIKKGVHRNEITDLFAKYRNNANHVYGEATTTAGVASNDMSCWVTFDQNQQVQEVKIISIGL